MKKLFISLCMLCSMVLHAQTLVIGTYNIRYDNQEDANAGDVWSVRSPYIAQLIKFNDLDIFGAQECLHHQLMDLQAMLPDYNHIGVARDDGKQAGEYEAIFYKKDKFDLLDHGNFWFSEKPDRPGLGWDATCIRLCTWGKFRDKKTGFVFVHYNLHLDWDGKVARLEGAKLLVKKAKEISGKLPTIFTGDFNSHQEGDAYLWVKNSGMVRDSYEVAEYRYAPNGTFNGFQTNRWMDFRIDHVFLTSQFKVKRYGILTDTYRTKEADGTYKARTPSDHFPVVVVVEEELK